MQRFLVIAVLVPLFATDVSAFGRRTRYAKTYNTAPTTSAPRVEYQPINREPILPRNQVDYGNALDEVNAARARRGLRPFIYDPGLAQAAQGAANARAQTHTSGHTRNDFAYLPPGCHASAAGCAAWPSHLGWGACCTYEGYTYAGAAIVQVGNMRYMHLFVR